MRCIQIRKEQRLRPIVRRVYCRVVQSTYESALLVWWLVRPSGHSTLNSRGKPVERSRWLFLQKDRSPQPFKQRHIHINPIPQILKPDVLIRGVLVVVVIRDRQDEHWGIGGLL